MYLQSNQAIGYLVIAVILYSCVDAMWESDAELAERLAEEQAELARERAEQAEEAHQIKVQQDLERFANEQLAPAVLASDELAQMLRQTEKNLNALRGQLRALNRDPELDETYVAWRKRRDDMKVSAADLRRQIEDAYLAYQKYLLAPDSSAESEEFKRLIRIAEASAADAQERFSQLPNEDPALLK